MCGRYSFSASKDKLGAQFKFLDSIGPLIEQFNIAPTQKAYVITDEDPAQLQLFTWGLIPFWAKDRSMGSRMINARSETAMSKPAFREAFKKRRCWVLADSFYEWKKEGKKKQPYRIFHKNGSLLVFAGLWETWRSGDEELQSFTILTTSPNAEVASIHDRMPVILPHPEQQYAWFHDRTLEASQLLLQPIASGALDMYPVYPKVNKVSNQGPELHKPMDKQGNLFD